MLPLKVIVVDDEAPARREMARLLEPFTGIQIVGAAGDVDAARGLLQRVRPDVVFLDIQLDSHSGFELLEEVDPETMVVFVTAYEEYAVRAFEAGALDYLLKPVESERLRATMARITSSLTTEQRRDVPGEVFTARRWVFLEGEQPEFVAVETITRIQADGSRTLVDTADGGTRAAARSLQDWEKRLPEDFLRIHRGTIVNLRYVERVEPWSNYGYRVHLRGGRTPALMSRRYAVKAKDLLR